MSACSCIGGQFVIGQLDIHSCKDANKKDTCNPYPDNCLLVWCHTIGKNRVDNLYQAELRGSISALDSMQINKDQFIHAIRKGVEMQPLTAPHYKFVDIIKILNDRDNYTADTGKGVAVEYVTQTE